MVVVGVGGLEGVGRGGVHGLGGGWEGWGAQTISCIAQKVKW